MADAAEARCAAQIDDWQLRSAAMQFAAWRDALGAHAPRWVSVALSPDADVQFVQLVQSVTQLLQQQRLAPAELELRLQQHALTQHASAATTLQRLRELGVRLALEGLGHASASLSALSRLKVSSVIVDRHFVRQAPTVEAHRVLIKAITSLGASLDIVTVADGISSDEQRCTLRELGVQLGHGALFAAPLPADGCALWLMARSAPSGVAHHTP